VSYNCDPSQRDDGQTLSTRHSGGANILHADGHVSYRKRSAFPATSRNANYWTSWQWCNGDNTKDYPTIYKMTRLP
jgi:prepilin-type processing-associated H-X9-DG protein